MEYFAIIGFLSMLLSGFIVFLSVKSRKQFFEDTKKEYQDLKQEYDNIKNSYEFKKHENVKLSRENQVLKDKVKDYDVHLEEKTIPFKDKLQQKNDRNRELSEELNQLSESKKEIEDLLQKQQQVLFNKDFEAAKLENKYRNMLDQIQDLKNLDSYQRILREACLLRLFSEQKQVLFNEIRDYFPRMSDSAIRSYLKHLEKIGLVENRVKGVYVRGIGVPTELKNAESFDCLVKTIIGRDLRHLEEILG